MPPSAYPFSGQIEMQETAPNKTACLESNAHGALTVCPILCSAKWAANCSSIYCQQTPTHGAELRKNQTA